MSRSYSADPDLSLYLQQSKPNLIFLLDHKSMESVYVMIRMQKEADPVTLVLDGFREHK
jgi:hypothetical protein